MPIGEVAAKTYELTIECQYTGNVTMSPPQTTGHSPSSSTTELGAKTLAEFL